MALNTNDLKTVETRDFDRSFHVRRILNVIVLALLYSIVCFQRTCPTIVAAEMADAYGVKIADLNVFSAIFFYPYGIMQIFAGLLADIMEPCYLIGIFQIIAAAGAVLCGISNDMFVGCIGRFLVGFGCGPVYVPICRYNANWFSLKYYSVITGLLIAIGGVGGILAQGPLAMLCAAIGWRNAFYLFGGVTFVLSVITLIFIRGDPMKHGYRAVNIEMTEVKANNSIKEKLVQLKDNLITIVTYPHFWTIAAYSSLSNIPYYSNSGLWGSPYLCDIYGMTKQKAGNTLIWISIGIILCSLVSPPLANVIKTKKWVMTGMALIGTGASVYGYFKNTTMSYFEIAVVFVLFGFATMPCSSVSYPLLREYYHASLAGSAVGSVNTITNVLCGVFQMLSSYLIKMKGMNGDDSYTAEGYKIGIWLFSIVNLGLALLSTLIMKDTVMYSQVHTIALIDDEALIDQPSMYSMDNQIKPM